VCTGHCDVEYLVRSLWQEWHVRRGFEGNIFCEPSVQVWMPFLRPCKSGFDALLMELNNGLRVVRYSVI
jgi:hypothetical protein